MSRDTVKDADTSAFIDFMSLKIAQNRDMTPSAKAGLITDLRQKSQTDISKLPRGKAAIVPIGTILSGRAEAAVVAALATRDLGFFEGGEEWKPVLQSLTKQGHAGIALMSVAEFEAVARKRSIPKEDRAYLYRPQRSIEDSHRDVLRLLEVLLNPIRYKPTETGEVRLILLRKVATSIFSKGEFPEEALAGFESSGVVKIKDKSAFSKLLSLEALVALVKSYDDVMAMLKSGRKVCEPGDKQTEEDIDKLQQEFKLMKANQKRTFVFTQLVAQMQKQMIAQNVITFSEEKRNELRATRIATHEGDRAKQPAEPVAGSSQ